MRDHIVQVAGDPGALGVDGLGADDLLLSSQQVGLHGELSGDVVTALVDKQIFPHQGERDDDHADHAEVARDPPGILPMSFGWAFAVRHWAARTDIIAHPRPTPDATTTPTGDGPRVTPFGLFGSKVR